MSSIVNDATIQHATDYVVPGTCTKTSIHTAHGVSAGKRSSRRDATCRALYLEAALVKIPRLLGAIDRNPYRSTYGCLDRQYWHYRTACFPSEMYQEGALTLALIYATNLPGNRWMGNERVRDLAVAAIRFATKSNHRDGSCDDYYPFERALGAAVFSLQATAEAYRVLGLDDPELAAWFERRARWIIDHDESGKLANHHALAALGLMRVADITGKAEYAQAAETRLDTLLSWQSDEGWFEEYGGADPGYQTASIDCLAKIRRMTGNSRLDEPLSRAVAFARRFLHRDGSFAGEYGSRGTYHFYPHGMELLAEEHAEAADLADGFLDALATGRTASFDDDRLFTHHLANLIEAYVDWSPVRPSATESRPSHASEYLPEAQLLIRGSDTSRVQTIVSAARGGVFKHFGRVDSVLSEPKTPPLPATDAGLIIETTDGRTAVSQMHDLNRRVNYVEEDGGRCILTVEGPLHFSRMETATPIKQAILHTGMVVVGRWCRDLVRRLLQRRLITGRYQCPIRFTRIFECEPSAAHSLRVTDMIELLDARINIRRMSFGTDHQMAYVAASGVYQESALPPWTNLAPQVAEVNTSRSVTVVREFR